MTRDYRMPQPGEAWRHYKAGYPALYEIVGIATHTEHGKPMVIYRQYGDKWENRPLYASPLGVFLAEVKGRNGHELRFRFEREAPSAEPTTNSP